MSVGFGEGVEHATPFGHLADWTWVWAGLLVLAKALDAVTTAVGLLLAPGFVEANPYAATVFDSVGVVTGLVGLSLLTVLSVTLATELGARYLRSHDSAPGWGSTATRVVGYAPLSIAFVFAALHNAGLVVRVLLLG
jgi:hypothetical protein